MFAKLCTNPIFLLVGLLLTLSGVFLITLVGEKLLLGAGLLLGGSAIVLLSQRGNTRSEFEISKPGQTQK